MNSATVSMNAHVSSAKPPICKSHCARVVDTRRYTHQKLTANEPFRGWLGPWSEHSPWDARRGIACPAGGEAFRVVVAASIRHTHVLSCRSRTAERGVPTRTYATHACMLHSSEHSPTQKETQPAKRKTPKLYNKQTKPR